MHMPDGILPLNHSIVYIAISGIIILIAIWQSRKSLTLKQLPIVGVLGAGLFAANRVNLGKLWIGIGTGQGLFTIALRLVYDVWYGRIDLANNYVLWLMSSAAGLAILFSVIARSVSKGESENTFIRIIKFIIKKI